MGETRETRIKEYLHFNDVPVVALREGSWIEGKEKQFFLRGNETARVYFSLNDIREIRSGTDLCTLFNS
jgi:dipeptidase E